MHQMKQGLINKRVGGGTLGTDGEIGRSMWVGMYELSHPPWERGGVVVFWMEQISRNYIYEKTPISINA